MYFRIQAARVGIEPTASRFRAERCYQQQLSRSILFQSNMDIFLPPFPCQNKPPLSGRFWIFIQDFCIELDIVGCDVPSAVSRLSRYRQLNWRDPFWQENRGRKMKGKESSGSRIRTHTDCFKGRRPTISRSPNKTIHSKTFHIRVSCGNRTRLSELEVQHLCRSAKDTIVFIAATTGLEPAFDSLTVSCRTVWLHRSVRDLRSQI